MARNACPNRSAGCKCDRCEEQRAYQLAWQKAHYDPEKARARRRNDTVAQAERARVWFAGLSRERRDAINARRVAAYAANPERGRESSRKWREKNPESHAAAVKKSRESRPLAHAEWAIRHPEKYLAKRQRDKALLRVNGAAYKARRGRRYGYEFANVVPLIDGQACFLCAESMTIRDPITKLRPSLDHVVPLSKGGAHDPSNLAWVHRRCNSSKRNKEFGMSVPEWFRAHNAERVRALRGA